MIRCIAIDDEPIALSIVRQYCERRGGIEVIGHGLDASVEFYAISYNRADGGDEEDVWGYGVSFARLVTYVNGGDQIANDCSSERLTRVVDEYLRKSLWIE